MKKLLFSLVVAAALLATSAYAQVNSSGTPTTLNGTSCNSCSMANMSVTSPITIDGAPFKADLSGTTASIGGSLLTAGCTSGAVTITGAATGMVAFATPLTFPGNNIQWQAYVSSANTVTVSLCTSLTLTPTASVYYVRVIQ